MCPTGVAPEEALRNLTLSKLVVPTVNSRLRMFVLAQLLFQGEAHVYLKKWT